MKLVYVNATLDLRLETLFSNPVFQSAVASLVLAQFIKSIISVLRAKSTSFKDLVITFLWKTGGMPSSHSAMAVSLSVAIALTEGFSSLFILSMFFALVVTRDALGVRRAAGLQAKALNRLGSELAIKYDISFKSVKEVHGHTAPEVGFGAVLGFFIALAFCTL